MAGKLDWKWIGIGVLIMVALSIAAGFILALILGPQLREMSGAPEVDQIALSTGQIALVALFNVLAFLIGGFVVGIKSAGRTIVEPGLSAAIAVLIGLLLSQQFSLANLFVGGLVPFVAGIVGGWLGERRQSGAW